MQVLEAADLGGYQVAERRVFSKGRSRYLLLSHPSRPRVLVRVSDHPPSQWSHPIGRPHTAFAVHTARGLAHLVRLLSRGRFSLTGVLRPGQAEPSVSGRGEGEAPSAAATVYRGGASKGGTGENQPPPLKASALDQRCVGTT